MKKINQQRSFHLACPYKDLLKIKFTILIMMAFIGWAKANAYGPNTKVSFKTGPITVKMDLESMEQSFVVNGTVTDNYGEPLPGANIMEKGTSNGTQTDFDGNFQLSVLDLEAVLEVSYLGFGTMEIPLKGRTTLKIQLEESASGLDEVVLVGYGSQSKATLTGSITNMTTEKIAQIPSADLTTLLAGRLSGVTISSNTGMPGISSDLTIRARGTWNNATPVYVIDGIVKSKADFDALDVNEVEEVSILKDAASGAIYGARAANGVVLVNTKKGQSGKPTINYISTYSVERPTIMPEMMSGIDIAKMANTISESSWFSWSQEDLDWLRTVNNGYGYDYLDEVYKDPYSSRHAVSISGGSDAVKYYIGGSIFKQTGFLEPISFDKNNLRANIDVKISDNLTANVNLAISNSLRQRMDPPGDGSDSGGEGLWTKLQTWNFYDPIFIDGKAPNLGWLGNVGGLINDSGYMKNRGQNQNVVLGLTYKIPNLEGLSAKITYANNQSTNDVKIFQKKHTLYEITGHTPHNFSQVEFTGETVQSNWPSRESLSETAYFNRSYQFNTQINYKRTFGYHGIDALFAYEQSEGFDSNFGAGRYDFPILVRDQWNQTSGVPEDSWAGGSESETGRLSYVGRLNYDFRSKYLLTASFRYDGSLIFKPSERWGLFPSISAGWVVSEEKFFDINFIERLKLRASYGTVGNDAVDPWRWQEQYVAGAGYFLGQSPREVKGIQYGGITNPFMTWETSESTNFGLDINLTNNLSFALDIWGKRTKDILGSQLDELPSTVGGNIPNTNYGEMKSHGYEIEVDYNNNIGDFNYYLGANYGYATDEVVKIAQGDNIRDFQNRIGRSWNYIAGLVYDDILRTQEDIDALPEGYTIYGQTPQLGQINYRDISGVDGVPDGKIDGWDNTVIADNAAPTSTYGIKLGGSLKGITVDVLFQGTGGYKKILSAQAPYGWTRVYGIWQDYWSPENVNATMPKPNWDIASDRYHSTFWLKNADYLRLRYLNIGYDLPEKVLNTIGVKKLKLFISGTNLFTISKFKDYDVELGSAGVYPNMQNYSLGLDITL